MKGLSRLVLLAALVAVWGCARPEMRCTSPEDTPAHHYLAGMELLEEDKADAAQAKFDRAVWCDDRYAPAHAGSAIAGAMKAAGNANDGYREVDLRAVGGSLELARKRSRTPEDEFAWRLAEIRASTIVKGEDWLDEAEDAYRGAGRLEIKNGIIFYKGPEAADYFMGEAYLGAREFQKARERFASVLDSRSEGRWHAKADLGWKRTDKVVRALSGMTLGDAGKEIALKGTVTRAEVATLFVDELKVDRLFAGRVPVKAPEADFIPADAAGSPFRDEITTMVKWGVRGMEPVYDRTARAYLFRPDEPVRRKELALALEDIVIKLTGDEGLSGAFLGHQRSPFPDVDASAAWYNAVMSVTARNLMETALSGEFRPEEPVDGAEAVLAVRVLKYRLNIE